MLPFKKITEIILVNKTIIAKIIMGRTFLKFVCFTLLISAPKSIISTINFV